MLIHPNPLGHNFDRKSEVPKIIYISKIKKSYLDVISS
jgi:hypothetical protein